MQRRHAATAALAIFVMVVSVMLGGRAVLRQQGVDAGDRTPPAAIPAEPATAETPKNQPEKTPVTSTATDLGIVGPPQAGTAPLERIEPRAPLSELSLAVPPKPKTPEDLAGEPLFHPVAEAAGVIEAKGQSLTVSGIEVVKPDETCTDSAGKNWPCGVKARTAFRGFLRGRAVTCAAPDKAGAAQCRVGNQDIGAWLVENGWARALPDGPYADAGRKASEAAKGVYGAAPDLSALPPVPAVTPEPLPGMADEPSSILDESGTAATPPDQSAPVTPLPGFPPAPVR